MAISLISVLQLQAIVLRQNILSFRVPKDKCFFINFTTIWLKIIMHLKKWYFNIVYYDYKNDTSTLYNYYDYKMILQHQVFIIGLYTYNNYMKHLLHTTYCINLYIILKIYSLKVYYDLDGSVLRRSVRCRQLLRKRCGSPSASLANEPCQRALSPIRMSTTSSCKLSMYGYVFGSVLAIALHPFAAEPALVNKFFF